jgi:glycosyltransferase involved in cell wall biosynthesis
MNILLSNSTDIFAGGEDYVLILARYLRLRGHTVSVSALPGHLLLAKCTSAGIPTVPIDYRGMNRVFAVASALRRELRSRAIDVVHSNANYDRTVAALATAGTASRHVAGVHSTHSIQHNITHWIRNRWGIDHFITDADAGKEVLIREDHIDARRITTVPIGIEDEPPEARAVAREAARIQLGVNDRTVVIGNVARLVPFKGHRILLDAIALVARQEPGVFFPIIGDGELLETLQAQAQSLGIAGKIRFLGFQDNLHLWYPAFDVYCHSSLELAAEMFPIAILRALSTGLPVVCSRVGGIALMVRDGASGYLVPPEDPGALAASLLQVIRDAALRKRMGAASAALFREQFHAAAMAEKVDRVYQGLAGTR